ncbi:hypothetical protein Tco_0236419 [Tanacetum coccineum]
MSVNALYQPWKAVLSMINMCLIGKTIGYDRPRHLVLQILWGIIHHSNIDYAERIWEEFVQSKQTFLTDRKNLAMDAHGKKKTAYLLIPNVRFTKLIIHHMRTKHNIHLRTGSPLHHSHDESILKTFRFVGKDEHVAKYKQFLDEERGKAVKKGATESSEATKVTKPKAAKATKPAGDKAPKPYRTTTSYNLNHHLHQPSKACKPKSPLKLVDEPSNEGVPVEEPAYNKEDADLERALEISLMKQRAQTQGPTRLVGGILLCPLKSFAHAESPSMDAELNLTDSETESDVEASKINIDSMEGQRTNPGEQDEGQARPNPGTLDEGQAGSNPGDTAGSQPPPSHVVHAGPNLEHMDLETTDASTQHKPEQMDEGFTTTAYPNVQENLKLPTEDQVILEEPASSTGTLSSLQNLDKDLSFTDQFFMEKPHEENSGKTNAETEVQSMVSVPIHQDTSSVPPMTTPVIDLTTMQSDSPLPTSTATTSIITTTTIPPTPQPQQSTTDLILVRRIESRIFPTSKPVVDEIVIEAVDWASKLYYYSLHGSVHYLFKTTSSWSGEARKKRQRDSNAPGSLWVSPSQPPPPPSQPGTSGALGTSGASGSSQLLPPLPPPSTGTSRSTPQKGREAPSSSKTTASAQQSMAWTTSDTRYESTGIAWVQGLSPSDELMHDDSALDEQVHVSDDQDSGNDYTPAAADSRKD